MKIPKTTEEHKFIEFRFSKRGKLTLKAVNYWWGGINSGFICSDGSEGNACKPHLLNKYIQRFKENKVKNIEKEIERLQKEIEAVKKKWG